MTVKNATRKPIKQLDEYYRCNQFAYLSVACTVLSHLCPSRSSALRSLVGSSGRSSLLSCASGHEPLIGSSVRSLGGAALFFRRSFSLLLGYGLTLKQAITIVGVIFY